tara:strand:+ start:22933 stop:23556 length:624 start_codon:yes stop_codon:yes gene_type:complete
MKKIFLLLTVVSLILTSCGSDNSVEAEGNESKQQESDGHDHDHGDHDHSSSETAERNIQSSDVESNMADAIVDAYLEIKNGLVADDKEAAAKGAESLLASFKDFDMTQLSDEQHTDYMDIMENSKEQAEHIVKSPIDHQREHFEVLSVDLNDMIDLIGTSKSLFQDFCPMASGGKGATWISSSEEIQNPYFGSKMVDCGEIQNKINE